MTSIRFVSPDGEELETADESEQAALIEMGFEPMEPVTPEAPTESDPSVTQFNGEIAKSVPVKVPEPEYEPIPFDHVLILDKDGNEQIVAQDKLEKTLALKDPSGAPMFEPALEFVDKSGEVVAVRRRDYDAAKQKGLIERPVWVAQQDAMKMDPVGPMEAAGYGGANTAFMETADDIYSGLGGDKQSYQRRDKQALKDSPVSYRLGQAGGILGTLPLQIGTRLPAIAGMGAVGGGVSAYGASEGSLMDRLKTAGKGALAGGATSLALGGIPKLAGKAWTSIGGTAEDQAYRATGAMQSGRKFLGKISDERQAQRNVGRRLLDDKVIGIVPRNKDILAERAQSAIDRYDDLNDPLIRSTTGVDKTGIARKLENVADETAALPPSTNLDLADAIRRESESIRKLPSQSAMLSGEDAVALKRLYNKDKNYGMAATEANRAEAERTARSAIRQAIEDAVEKQNPMKGDYYRQNNQKIGQLISGKNLLTDALGRENNRNAVTLSDTILAAGGLGLTGSTENPAFMALAAPVALRLSRAYGNQVAAKIMDTYQKLARTQGFQLARAEVVKRFGAQAGEIIGEDTGASPTNQ